MDFKLRFSERKTFIGTCIASIVSTVALFLRGDCMGMIAGLCIIGLAIIGFFLIMIIRPIPTIEQNIKHSKIVWGMWFTGETVFNKRLYKKYKSIRRILLMKPNSNAFYQNIKVTSAPERETREQIINLTREARAVGITVKWYSEYNNIGLTICDKLQNEKPSSTQAWCVVQVLKDAAPQNEREIHMGKNIPGKDTYFKGMLNRFEEIWDDKTLCREPSPEEYSRISEK
jgi:hypothetical protein